MEVGSFDGGEEARGRRRLEDGMLVDSRHPTLDSMVMRPKDVPLMGEPCVISILYLHLRFSQHVCDTSNFAVVKMSERMKSSRFGGDSG